jgi:hypothetical protein
MSSVAVAPKRIPLDRIHVSKNMRTLDEAHVEALAKSIALRWLIVPLVVRPDGERFTSRRETGRKALERLTKPVLPASHVALQRALEREARTHVKRQSKLDAVGTPPADGEHGIAANTSDAAEAAQQ